MGKLHNKVVFITGSTSGIGKASAIEAAKDGATVVVADLENTRCKATMQEISAFGQKTLFVSMDVADANSVKQAIETTVKTFGRLDVGLNNAGIGFRSKNVAESSEEEYLRVININLNGVFYCMKYELNKFCSKRVAQWSTWLRSLALLGRQAQRPMLWPSMVSLA